MAGTVDSHQEGSGLNLAASCVEFACSPHVYVFQLRLPVDVNVGVNGRLSLSVL